MTRWTRSSRSRCRRRHAGCVDGRIAEPGSRERGRRPAPHHGDQMEHESAWRTSRTPLCRIEQTPAWGRASCGGQGSASSGKDGPTHGDHPADDIHPLQPHARRGSGTCRRCCTNASARCRACCSTGSGACPGRAGRRPRRNRARRGGHPGAHRGRPDSDEGRHPPAAPGSAGAARGGRVRRLRRLRRRDRGAAAAGAALRGAVHGAANTSHEQQAARDRRFGSPQGFPLLFTGQRRDRADC